jgi:hypothetical protein
MVVNVHRRHFLPLVLLHAIIVALAQLSLSGTKIHFGLGLLNTLVLVLGQVATILMGHLLVRLELLGYRLEVDHLLALVRRRV